MNHLRVIFQACSEASQSNPVEGTNREIGKVIALLESFKGGVIL